MGAALGITGSRGLSKDLPSGWVGAPCHVVVGDSCTRGSQLGSEAPPLVMESKEPRAAEREGAIWVGAMSRSLFAMFGQVGFASTENKQ